MKKNKPTLFHHKKNDRLIALVGALILFGVVKISAGDLNIIYSESTVFRIVSNNQSVPILYDRNDADVVGVSAKALADDIKLITNRSPLLLTNQLTELNEVIIVGTIGKSKPIDEMIKAQKLLTGAIKGQWESFLIQVVDNPIAGIKRALVICGSDPRGTAFGIFELSKRLGVSPWVYWADVIPAKKEILDITIDELIMGPPSVKYRGIFLNDEDWGLQPWAVRNIDTDIKDIGPRTYARIFELMLRLKANYIWTAMHPCTKAFFYYEENSKVAANYNIVLGSSHCEPMLRNNVDEWKNNFTEEYGKQPGPWRYDTNEIEIKKYWEDRVRQVNNQNVEAVFTVGMRGIHDSGLPGPETMDAKVELLNKIIEDQRNLFTNYLGKDASSIPQIFCPYKEVLDIYNAGAMIPDDVTIVWADDNHGYIRKLSTPEEQQRSGGSGVYYHLSYWGAPEDYLWLSSTSPSLISFEMSKAYAYGADRLWIFNVGDIKPAEMETEFAMDLAWDVYSFEPKEAENYLEKWAERTFGKDYAKEISEIKKVYYRLAASGKPEHMDKIEFPENEMRERISTYHSIADKTKELKKRIPEHLQDAYFQLILYPVLGAAYMNEKHFYAQMGEADKSKHAYDEIKKLTNIYNTEIAGGKWSGMMNMSPRDRKVFDIPEVKEPKTKIVSSDKLLIPIRAIAAGELTYDETQLHLIPGLGISNESISWKLFIGPMYNEEQIENAPSASIKLELPKGKRAIELICVPTHAVHEGRGLRTAIHLGNNTPVIVDVNTPSGTETWSKNVIRGYSSVKNEFVLEEDNIVELKLSLLDPGMAISKIFIY